MRGMSATDLIKNLVFGKWNGPPRPRALGIARTAAKNLPFLEKDIPLPQELQFDDTRPVFDVLFEDAVMFYTVRLPRGCLTTRNSRFYLAACSRT